MFSKPILPLNPDDGFDELDLSGITNEDNIWAAQAPGGKYASSTMSSWLGAAFQPIKIGNAIVAYQGKVQDTIVFPPVTDGKPTHHTLTLLSDALTKAEPSLSKVKKMIFPLAEEQGFFFGWGPRRMHWVTLHYDTTTQTATLIDSRPTLNSWSYLTEPMKQLLNEGLERLHLRKVETFNHLYLGTQHDDIFCGAWTATTIEALANGMSIGDHTTTISSADKEGIIEHNRRLIIDGKSTGIYQRESTRAARNMVKSNSCDSISTATTSASSLSSLDSNGPEDLDWVMENNSTSPMITAKAHAAQIKAFNDGVNDGVRAARAKFRSSLHAQDELLSMLIHREGIRHNNLKLTRQSCGNQSAEDLLAAVESVYKGMSVAEITQSSLANGGYTLHDPARFGGPLKMMGFDENAINAMGLTAVLKYDAAISAQFNIALEQGSLSQYQAMLSDGPRVSLSPDDLDSPLFDDFNQARILDTCRLKADFQKSIYAAFAEEINSDLINSDLILAQKTDHPKHALNLSKTALSAVILGRPAPFTFGSDSPKASHEAVLRLVASSNAPSSSPQSEAMRMMNYCLTYPSSELCFMRGNSDGRVLTHFNLFNMRNDGKPDDAILSEIMKEYSKGECLAVGVCSANQINRVQALIDPRKLTQLRLGNTRSESNVRQASRAGDLPQAPTPIQNNPLNYSFLIATLAHPVTKNLSVIILMASLLLLGLVTAGLSSIPVMAGTVLAAVGMFSGAAMSMGNRWALQQSSDKSTMTAL